MGDFWDNMFSAVGLLGWFFASVAFVGFVLQWVLQFFDLWGNIEFAIQKVLSFSTYTREHQEIIKKVLRSHWAPVSVFIVGILLLLYVGSSSKPVSSVANLHEPRAAHFAVELNDHRIFLIGGHMDGGDGFIPLCVLTVEMF